MKKVLLAIALLVSFNIQAESLIDVNTVKANIGDYGNNHAGQGAALTNGVSTSNANSKVGDTTANGGGGTGVGQVSTNASSANQNSANGTVTGTQTGTVTGTNKLDNKNSVNGENTTNVDSKTTNKTNVTSEGDTTNVNSKLMWLPSHAVAVSPSIVAGATVIVNTGTCGFRQKLKTNRVVGTFHVIWGANESIDLGPDDTAVPDDKPFVEYKHGNLAFLVGHQITTYTSVITTGGARQFSIGGNGTNGGGGSGAAGASSATQQLVKRIQLTECILNQIDTSKQ